MLLSAQRDLGTSKLQVIVSLESSTVPAWIAEIVRQIKLATFLQVTNVLFTGPCPNSEMAEGSFLYKRYLEWDGQRADYSISPFGSVDIAEELRQIASTTASPAGADAILWLSNCDPRQFVSEIDCDRLLRFRTGNSIRNADVPPYFWELYRRDPVNRSAWELSDSEGRVTSVLGEAFSSNENSWSVNQNSIVPYWTAPALLLKSLRKLWEGKPNSELVVAGASEGSRPPERTPTNLQVAGLLARSAIRSVSRRISHSGKEPYWFVAFRSNLDLFVAHNETFRQGEFQVIEAPEGHFFADPFVLTRDGRTWVFLEDFPYKQGRGVISVVEIRKDGTAGQSRCVLERPYHLSYPFVFEHDGKAFMIPETMDAHRVELYQAVEFPWCWELVHVLRENMDAVDTTLWIENGIFYYFTNVVSRGVTPNDLLYLFCAESLTGEWYPHPANPVCSDVRHSRSAGKLFRRNGKLIRPAQDCSVRYGYACQLNEVRSLSPDAFAESFLSRIEPNWFPNLIGTHTINSDDVIEVIDGQIYKAR